MLKVKDTLRSTVHLSYDGRVVKVFHGPKADERFANEVRILRHLEARGELALHGVSSTAGWGAVAASAAGIAMLALAFGAILVLMPHVGPLLATLIVVGALLAVAAFAGWRAHIAYNDIRTALRRDLTNEGLDD